MNVILTGIPRAGTTLAAALIDGLSDTVCLNEPHWHNAQAASNAGNFAQFITDDFMRIRAHLLAGKPLPDRRGKHGEAITNYFARDAQGTMQNTFTDYPLTRAGLSGNFTLAVKHNGPYLAVLPELIAKHHFKIIAIIRSPLPVISSWRRLNVPISRGDMPNAKAYWPALNTLINSPIDLLEKQVRLYDMMLARILEYSEFISVVRYESLIESPDILPQLLGKKPVETSLIQPQPTMDEPAIGEAITRFSTHAKNYESLSLNRSL